MIEQNTKTRLQLKIDTSENWKKATGFIPKKGEPIVYQDEAGILLKIGDGARVVNELPFSGNAFVATYGVTAFEEIYSAHAQGRYVILNDIENNYLAQLVKISSEMIAFSAIDHLRSFAYEVTWDNLWSLRQLSLENSSNKITNLNGSTHQYYPTAKAVTDYIHSATDFYYYNSLLQAIEDINNHVWNGATTDLETAKVKVFTADNGALTVMLLDDISTTERIRINKDINLVLNGKVLTFTDNLSAYLMLGRDTSCYIDGTVSGSAINKSVIVAAEASEASTGKTSPAILSGKNLTINGGSYNASGSFCSEHIVTIGSYGENSSILLENCSISVTDEDSTAPSYISGLNLDAAVESAILKNVTINVDTANGKAIAIDAYNPKLKLEVYNSQLTAITRPKWSTNASANGIFMTSGLLKIKDSIVHTDAQNDTATENYPLAIGLWLTGCKAFLENTNVAGTHSGIQFGDGSTEGEELYVKGGILKSFAHGGIYAVGGSKVCVRDAILRCGEYDGIFDYTSDEVFESGYLVKPYSNLYVAGDGTTVYLDGCTLDSDESRWGFVAKNGTNIVINISNSTVVEGTEKIRLDDASFRANVGVGTNLTFDSFIIPSLVTFTGKVYRKIHEEELCNGNDYNALAEFNDSLIELISNENGYYYNSLSQAILDINDGVTANSIGDWNIAKVKVSTSDVGRVAITILKDLTETTTMEINKDVELILNGRTINLYNEAAQLNFNSNNSIIDGTAVGSTISKTFPSVSNNNSIITVNSGNLVINNGTYSSSGSLISSTVMIIKAASTANKLELNNCTISNVGTESTWDGSIATGIQSQAIKTIIKNSSINIDTKGKAYGLLSMGEVNIINSNIETKTKSMWGNLETYGIYANGGVFKIKDCKIHTDAPGNNAAHTRSIGIKNYATLFLENTDVFGTYVGVMNSVSGQRIGNLYISGGTLTGHGYGGIFAEQGETGTIFAKDCIVRCDNYEGVFDYISEDRYTSYLSKPYANFYTQEAKTSIYFDGCTIDNNTGSFGFKIKGANNIVYLSNSAISGGLGKISIDEETSKVYAGFNTNASSEMFSDASKLTLTDELYRKLHKDEVCNGADYNAYITFLNYKKEDTNSYILTSSTEGSTKKFKITIDDDGVLTATEIIESGA